MLPIEKALKKSGNVSIRGWIYRIRKLKDKIFIVLRDSTDIVQCVIKDPKLVKIADNLLMESSLEITGKIYSEKRAPNDKEIEVKKLNVVHSSEDFPIGKDQSQEFLMDNRHLWIRSRKMSSILKIRSTIFGAIHEYFRKLNYYEHQSPTLTPNAAEGGSTLFKVNYFGKEVYLTQTWQLYAEAVIFGLEKIYTIAPSFRAEKSKTSRHLTEYWHAEVEATWMDLDGLINLGEGLIKYCFKKVLKENKKDLEILGRDVKKLQPIVNKKFKVMSYDEVLKFLNKKGMKVKWGKDLRTVEEDVLSKSFDVPIFIINYPKDVKAFYMKENPENKKTVLCFDLIGTESYGEIIGASVREDDVNELIRKLKLEGEDPKKYSWYLDTRRYGSVPHSGFGMGVERLVAWICGLDNIKDAIAFPRTMLRYQP